MISMFGLKDLQKCSGDYEWIDVKLWALEHSAVFKTLVLELDF